MPTVVDSLVVSLGLDATAFTAGQKQMVTNLRQVESVATRTAKNLQASGSQAAEFFSAIKVEALSLLGVFLGGKGLESFIRDTSRSLRDLGATAGFIGESAQDIQAFELAIARMGGSIDAAHQSLLGLAKAKQDWLTFGTGSQQFGFMQAIGASITMSPLQIMQRFDEYIRSHIGLPGGEAQIRQMGEGAEIGFNTTTAMIQMARSSSLAEQMRRSAELGDVASKQQIDAATQFQSAVVSFEQAVEGFSRSAVPWEGLTSAIKELTQDLLDVRNFFRGNVPKQPPIAAPTSGPNAWWDNLWNSGGSGTGSSSGWWEWLLGGDMQRMRGAGGASGGGYPWSGGASSAADTTMTPAKLALLNAIAGGESSGADPYNQRNGQGGSAMGRYQFMPGTWADISNQTGLKDFTPINQDRNAWALASRAYSRYTFGRNLEADLNAGGHDADIIAALRGTWPSLPGGTQPNPATSGFLRRLHGGLPAGGGPIFGPQRLPDPALAPGRLAGPRVPVSTSMNDDHSSMNIGTINVHTQATDAKGIAADIHKALADDIMSQANRGLQ